MAHERRTSGNHRRVAFVVAIALSLTGLGAPARSTTKQEPLDRDLREHVEVQLVLIDTVILDRRDRTVDDLTLEDFELIVDGRRVEPASLDISCVRGAVEDPRAGESLPPVPPGAPPPAEPRRIVFVFDYYHMDLAHEALTQAQQAVLERSVEGEEHMVVALAEMLRVEQPFQPDPRETARTFERMRTDKRLYAGNYGRLTERRFFQRVEALFDVLEQIPGRKVVVLYSGPFLSDGFTYDPTFKQLSAMSGRSRTAIYPVDSGGMRTLLDPDDTGTSGPPMLRRLANETGGRMTANTNDLNLAYTRAQRDTSCTYTLGFYDRGPRLDKNRRLTVRVKRPGHRAIYPQHYVIRSQEKQRRSLMRTATMAPGLFEDVGLKAETFVVQLASNRRWESIVALEVALDPLQLEPDDREWDLRVVIRKPWGTVVESYKTKLALPSAGTAATDDSTATWFDRATLKPGEYLLNVVLAHPASDKPLTTSVRLDVPEIPPDEPFLVGPIVGAPVPVDEEAKRSDVVARVGVEPLIGGRRRLGAPLVSLVHVCRRSLVPESATRRITRELSAADGRVLEVFGPSPVEFAAGDKLRCEPFRDSLAGSPLTPGSYAVRAYSSGTAGAGGRVTFTIDP